MAQARVSDSEHGRERVEGNMREGSPKRGGQEGAGGEEEPVGRLGQVELTHIRWMAKHQGPMHSTGNCVHYPVINRVGKGHGETTYT